MIQIGICDDKEYVAKELNELIQEICLSHDIHCKIYAFTSSKKLLEHSSELSVVFLDIEMPEMDGIKLGRMIRESNRGCKIIMATGMVKRFKEAFLIDAMRFVTKPFDKKEVEEALLAAVGNDLGTNTIEVSLQRNKYMICQIDIQYIVAANGYVEVYANGKVFRKVMSLDGIEELLEPRLFAKIDRKYIVNLRYTQMLKDGHVMVGDKEFSVSRRKKKEFEHKYIEFDLNYRRSFE